MACFTFLLLLTKFVGHMSVVYHLYLYSQKYSRPLSILDSSLVPSSRSYKLIILALFFNSSLPFFISKDFLNVTDDIFLILQKRTANLSTQCMILIQSVVAAFLVPSISSTQHETLLLLARSKFLFNSTLLFVDIDLIVNFLKMIIYVI